MNNKVKCIISFIAGTITGGVGTFLFMKNKWMRDFEAKRNEMIRYYESKKPEVKVVPVEEIKLELDDEEVKKSAEKIIQACNYSKISTPERTKNMSPILNDSDYDNDAPVIYEIDSREFGSQEMYGMVTLYLYDDGEIRTEKYELLNEDDVENYIGSEMLKKLANQRDSDPDLDSFYVRNNRLRTDYEILIESGRYEE